MAAHKTTFEVSVYKKSCAFTIPKQVRDELGITGGDSVHLIVKAPSGTELFNGRKTLKSGPEIYGKDISGALTPGSMIVLEALEPRVMEAAAEAESFDAQERNAGFQSNPGIRREVEEYAMDMAKEKLESLGFSDFIRTSKTECYDYICKRDGARYYIEVKGTQLR